ncbi:MAG: glycosyltransferase family 4 protein [Promethearchaeota archaeon]
MNHILFLPTRYYPSISGAEFYFQRMAEILTKKYDYEIDIFTSNAIDFRALRNSYGRTITNDNDYYYKVNNIKINRFSINYNLSHDDILNRLRNISSFKSLNISYKSLIKFIENGPYMQDLINFFLNEQTLNYDLVHATFYPYFNLINALLIGNIIKKPKICTPFFHFSNPRYLDSSLIEVLSKFDVIIACTNLEKEILIRKFGIQEHKIVVIPMGVDYERFKANENSKHIKFSFKENFFKKKEKNYKLVLFCGHKNYEKGAISILKAIPYILRNLHKVYFVFIGPSTLAFNRELSKVQKLKNTRIINFTPDNLTGYYDRKKISAFREADLYLMPSRSDAFGISFLEAWAAGKPVIGARIGATPEIIRENINGLLVEFDNPIDIARKVVVLLKNKKLRKKLGLVGQLNVSQSYTWDLIAKKTHKLYQNLINEN